MHADRLACEAVRRCRGSVAVGPRPALAVTPASGSPTSTPIYWTARRTPAAEADPTLAEIWTGAAGLATPLEHRRGDVEARGWGLAPDPAGGRRSTGATTQGNKVSWANLDGECAAVTWSRPGRPSADRAAWSSTIRPAKITGRTPTARRSPGRRLDGIGRRRPEHRRPRRSASPVGMAHRHSPRRRSTGPDLRREQDLVREARQRRRRRPEHHRDDGQLAVGRHDQSDARRRSSGATSRTTTSTSPGLDGTGGGILSTAGIAPIAPMRGAIDYDTGQDLLGELDATGRGSSTPTSRATAGGGTPVTRAPAAAGGRDARDQVRRRTKGAPSISTARPSARRPLAARPRHRGVRI